MTWGIYVINLDRSPQRWARMKWQLDALGVPYERLAAVDARTFTPEEAMHLDRAAYERLHGKSPLMGELGCYLSHVKLMHHFLASDHRWALALEDDVTLTPSLTPVLEGLAIHGQHWDMVKLSAVHSGTPRTVFDLTRTHRLAVMFSRCTGSSAYAINRMAARRYLDGLLPMQLPYDHVFDRGWEFGLKVRMVSPTPCVHGDAGDSTNGSGRARQKFHWTQRCSAHVHRVVNEARRLRYAWHQWRDERSTRTATSDG